MQYRDFKLKRRKYSELIMSDTDSEMPASSKDKDGGLGLETDARDSASPYSQLDTTSSCGEGSSRSFSGTDSGVDMDWERQSDASSQEANGKHRSHKVSSSNKYSTTVNSLNNGRPQPQENRFTAESQLLNGSLPFTPLNISKSSEIPRSVAQATYSSAGDMKMVPILASALDPHSCKTRIVAFPVLNWSYYPINQLADHKQKPAPAKEMFAAGFSQSNNKMAAMPHSGTQNHDWQATPKIPQEMLHNHNLKDWNFHYKQPSSLCSSGFNDTGSKYDSKPLCDLPVAVNQHHYSSHVPLSSSSISSSPTSSSSSPSRASNEHHHHHHPRHYHQQISPRFHMPHLALLPGGASGNSAEPLSTSMPNSQKQSYLAKTNLMNAPLTLLNNGSSTQDPIGSSFFIKHKEEIDRNDGCDSPEALICAVCNDVASGLHYGVVTCEG